MNRLIAVSGIICEVHGHVIKIRYADLPAGLHIEAVARGRDTVIYMLPGLTAAQRQAALRRARSSARMGQGPRLPAAGVLGAVIVDRMRTTVRNGVAAMRGHPAILVPPLVIVMSAAVAYILLVSVHIGIHDPQSNGGTGTPIPAALVPPGSRADDPGARPGPTSPVTSRQAPKPAHKRSGGGQGAKGASPSPSPTPSPATSTSDPSPSPSPSAAAAPSPTAGGVNSTGSGSGSPGVGGQCIDPGPPGECQAS
jgi:hypothetical protein